MRPMAKTQPTKRRADAERSIARVQDAAIDALTSDPDASMAEIARRAGVVRATIYVHFPTREDLIGAITERAIGDVADVIAATEPERGAPAEALRRVIEAAWQALARFHALVAVNTRRPVDELHALHRPVLDLLEPLVERGQRDGSFRGDVPVRWHLSMILALIHAASGELRAERLAADRVQAALVETVLGAVAAASR
jgi:TetR/AcrR family transcriptional repressor of mexCD-oprJ operon